MDGCGSSPFRPAGEANFSPFLFDLFGVVPLAAATGSPPFVGGSGALRSSEASLSSFSSSRSSPPLSVSGRFSRAAPRIPALCIPNHGFVSQTYCLLYFFESNPFQSENFFLKPKTQKVLWAWIWVPPKIHI
jgi:hypothetical protein